MTKPATRPRAAVLGMPLRWMGPGAVLVLTVGYGLFWYAVRPGGEPVLAT